MFPSNISEQELDGLPRMEFPGQILVVDTPQTMEYAAQVLSAAQAIGYDTETRPSFTKGVTYPMALLQLSTDKQAFLFRLQKVELSDALMRVLESEDIIKVGAAIGEDIRGLQKIASFRPRGFLDLQQIVHEWGVQEKSVKKMAAIVLEIKISKAQRLSNWQAVTLTPAQMDYAAMDAWVCLRVYEILNQIKPIKVQPMPEAKASKTSERKRFRRPKLLKTNE